MERRPSATRKNKKQNAFLLPLISLGIIVVMGALVYVGVASSSDKQKEKPSENTTQGSTQTDYTLKEGTLLADTTQDEESFHYHLNTKVYFASGDREGSLMVGNPPGNSYLMKIEVQTLDGEILFASDFIKPGQYLEKAKLSKVLPKGTYEAEAALYAYTQDQEEIEVFYKPIEITVGK